MHKNVSMSARAYLDLLRNKAHAIFLQALDRSLQVRHAQRDVVQSLATLGDEFRYD